MKSVKTHVRRQKCLKIMIIISTREGGRRHYHEKCEWQFWKKPFHTKDQLGGISKARKGEMSLKNLQIEVHVLRRSMSHPDHF